MAKLIQFDKSRFKPLKGIKETLAKLLLYRFDFQKEVLQIREKYNLNNFPKLEIKKNGDYSELFTKDIDEAFEDDIERLIELVGYSLDDWLGFVYLFVRYDFITVPPEQKEFSEDSLKDIKDGYKKDKPLESVDRIIYDSPSVTVQTKQGEVLCFYRGIPDQEEAKAINGIINSALRAMGKKVQKYLSTLDYYSEIAELDRQGKNDIEIDEYIVNKEFSRLINDGFSEEKSRKGARAHSKNYGTIRKSVNRAKELGF
jgi:hypothetical protein